MVFSNKQLSRKQVISWHDVTDASGGRIGETGLEGKGGEGTIQKKECEAMNVVRSDPFFRFRSAALMFHLPMRLPSALVDARQITKSHLQEKEEYELSGFGFEGRVTALTTTSTRTEMHQSKPLRPFCLFRARYEDSGRLNIAIGCRKDQDTQQTTGDRSRRAHGVVHRTSTDDSLNDQITFFQPALFKNPCVDRLTCPFYTSSPQAQPSSSQPRGRDDRSDGGIVGERSAS